MILIDYNVVLIKIIIIIKFLLQYGEFYNNGEYYNIQASDIVRAQPGLTHLISKIGRQGNILGM